MVMPSPHDIFKAMFGHLPKEQYEVIEDLWALREEFKRTKPYRFFERYKLSREIKKLEVEAFCIGIEWAIKDLKKYGRKNK